jgi:protein tyrosine/serine phosphatase
MKQRDFRMYSYRFFVVVLLITVSLASLSFAQTNGHLAIKIDNFGRIDDHYFRGAQPKNHDYEDLARFGIKSVITLTNSDTDPNEEAIVKKSGMKYYQIPMESHTPPTASELAEFLTIVNDPANQPVYVHCAAGKHRTGIMTAIYRLTKHRWTADQAYKEMQKYKFGLALFHPKLKNFVYDYYEQLSQTPTRLDAASAVTAKTN